MAFNFSVLTITIGLILLHDCQSFASWFVERPTCWTNLRDPKEVIMNNFVVPYGKSPYNETEVFIQVIDVDTDEVIELINERDRNIIRLERSKVTDDNDDKGPRKFSFRLKFVVETEELKTYQYVMDAKILPEVEPTDDYYYGYDDEDENNDPQITASFVAFRRSGCEGERGFGVIKEGVDEGKGLELEIIIPPSLDISEDKEYGVNVVAAWATGRVVTLTKPIFFQISNETSENEINDEGEHDQVLDPEQNDVKDEGEHQVLDPEQNEIKDAGEHDQVLDPEQNKIKDEGGHQVLDPEQNEIKDENGHQVLDPEQNEIKDEGENNQVPVQEPEDKEL